MSHSLQVIDEYHARAVATGNTWAQTLARRVTYGLTPGEPSRERRDTLSEVDTNEIEDAATWLPRVGGQALHQSWGGVASRVTILELDGGYTRVQGQDAEVYWVWTAHLHPLVRS